MMSFSKIATFFQNQFTEKLIFDLFLKRLLNFFLEIRGYVKTIPIVYDMRF